MSKYKFRFLVGSIILIFMGAMLKLNNLPNYNVSFIAGIINFGLFLFFMLNNKIAKN